MVSNMLGFTTTLSDRFSCIN